MIRSKAGTSANKTYPQALDYVPPLKYHKLKKKKSIGDAKIARFRDEVEGVYIIYSNEV